MFNVNDKVVCIHGFDRPTNFSSAPIPHKVYVVREVTNGTNTLGKETMGLKLVGITGAINPQGDEWSFSSDGFKLLSEVQKENSLKPFGGEYEYLGGS